MRRRILGINVIMMRLVFLSLSEPALVQAGTWSRKADMPTARLAFSTCVLDGKIYAIGGIPDWPHPPIATLEAYDPVNDTWQRKADLPFQRYKMSVSTVDGKIYAMGGFGIWIHREVLEYSPALDT